MNKDKKNNENSKGNARSTVESDVSNDVQQSVKNDNLHNVRYEVLNDYSKNDRSKHLNDVEFSVESNHSNKVQDNAETENSSRDQRNFKNQEPSDIGTKNSDGLANVQRYIGSDDKNDVSDKNSNENLSNVQNPVENEISDDVKNDPKTREPITKENYKQYVFEKMPKSSHFKNMLWAFLIGGTICAIGQAFIQFYSIWFGKEDASILASGTLVFVAALLTGFGVYDNIGRFAGAGSTIPITGFSNAVVSPALEFRAEGYIYGVGAKMFQVAGPVIVNGVTISVIIATLSLIVDAIFHIW